MWLLRKVSNLELIDFEISETNDLINRAKEQLNGKIVPAYMAYIGVLQSFVFLISNLLVLVRSISVSVIFPIVFLAAIHSIAMFRLSKVQYDIIRARTNDARKMWYLQYLLTNDVVEFCKNKILDKNCNIYKQGKNWYCEIDNIKITINSYSYTIITAHLIK